MGLKLKLQQTKSQLVLTNGKVNTDTDDQSGKKTSKTEKNDFLGRGSWTSKTAAEFFPRVGKKTYEIYGKNVDWAEKSDEVEKERDRPFLCS